MYLVSKSARKCWFVIILAYSPAQKIALPAHRSAKLNVSILSASKTAQMSAFFVKKNAQTVAYIRHALNYALNLAIGNLVKSLVISF